MHSSGNQASGLTRRAAPSGLHESQPVFFDVFKKYSATPAKIFPRNKQETQYEK